MKIYGKTPGQIYDMLPWQYKAVMIASISFLLFIAIHLLTVLFRPAADTGREPLSIGGTGWENSVFDPALAVNPDTRDAFLAFTNFRNIGTGDRRRLEPGIRIAASRTPCKAWTTLTGGFDPREDIVVAPDGHSTIAAGVWRYETPALVHDPEDTERPWKLFAYKYLWTPDGNIEAARRYGVIVQSSSKDPIRGGWTVEEWAMSPGPGYPPPPYQELVKHHINRLHPSLSDVTLYARPSVVRVGKILLMSLSAYTTGKVPDRVVLLASFDHGGSWKYMGTPLTAADAAKTGAFTTLAGATLVQQDNHVYLATVFGNETTMGLGTFIMGFADISKGLLKRNEKTGAPLVFKHVPRNSAHPNAIGGGYAAYNDGCGFGMLAGEYSTIKKAFQIFKTQEKPVEK